MPTYYRCHICGILEHTAPDGSCPTCRSSPDEIEYDLYCLDESCGWHGSEPERDRFGDPQCPRCHGPLDDVWPELDYID